MKASDRLQRILAQFAAVGAIAVVVAGAADARAEAVSLRIDWLPRGYHAPFFLGIEKGWYREAGIELTVNDGKGSGNVVQLVGAGSDTFGFAGADAVVRAVQRGVPVVSVATLMPENAEGVSVLKSSDVTRVEQLEGRRIATTPGGTSDALLPAFLKGAGLRADQVTIVAIDGPIKAQAVLQGKVDAMNGPVWTASSLEQGGGSRTFPYAKYGVQVVGFGLVAHPDTLARSPDLVRRFVAVTTRAWQHAVAQPDDALAALEKLVPENAKPIARERNRFELPIALGLARPAVAGKPLGTHSEAAWEAMQRQLVEYGVVKRTLPVAQYLTNRFVE